VETSGSVSTRILRLTKIHSGNSIAGMEVEPGGYPTNARTLSGEQLVGTPIRTERDPRNPSGKGDLIIDLEQNVDFTPWLTTPPTRLAHSHRHRTHRGKSRAEAKSQGTIRYSASCD